MEALRSGWVAGSHPARRVDTHMSHVFLEPGHVLKLKRAVTHPFADMSQLEQRRRACEAELAINQAFAPALYENVEAVVRAPNGRFSLGGEGEVVDYLVRMKRFPDGSLFSELADRNALTVDMVEEAARALAAFHAKQPPRRDADASRSYARVIEDLRKTAGQGEPPPTIAGLARDVFDRLDALAASRNSLIVARRQCGLVRRGHGDFHLGNICLYKGQVTPFDALEFDETLATTDILYDIAFLLMDLRAKSLDAFAMRAMNAYLDAFKQDERGLALLPFFMALRAAVRMAVNVEARELGNAEHYGRLARRLLDPCRPRLVAVGGLSGSGKSVIARAVAPVLPGPCGARILRTDTIRKCKAGIAPTASMPIGAYNADSRRAVYVEVAKRTRDVLDTGTSVVADGTYREDEARAAIADVGRSSSFLGIWLDADPERRAERIGRRRNDASDATAAIALLQREPCKLEPVWQRVDANGSIVDTTRLVVDLIEETEKAT